MNLPSRMNKGLISNPLLHEARLVGGLGRLLLRREAKFILITDSRIYRVATKFDRQNSRIIQGCFKDLFVIFKDVTTWRKCRVAAPIREISAQCITLRAKFKDFRDIFQNSRTFQGYSKILGKIQGPFKDSKDHH